MKNHFLFLENNYFDPFSGLNSALVQVFKVVKFQSKRTKMPGRKNLSFFKLSTFGGVEEIFFVNTRNIMCLGFASKKAQRVPLPLVMNRRAYFVQSCIANETHCSSREEKVERCSPGQLYTLFASLYSQFTAEK